MLQCRGHFRTPRVNVLSMNVESREARRAVLAEQQTWYTVVPIYGLHTNQANVSMGLQVQRTALEFHVVYRGARLGGWSTSSPRVLVARASRFVTLAISV